MKVYYVLLFIFLLLPIANSKTTTNKVYDGEVIKTEQSIYLLSKNQSRWIPLFDANSTKSLNTGDLIKFVGEPTKNKTLLVRYMIDHMRLISDPIKPLAAALQIDMKTAVIPLKICKLHSEASRNYDAFVLFWKEQFLPYQKYCTTDHLDFSKTYIARPIEVPCMGRSQTTGQDYSSQSCTQADILGWVDVAVAQDPKISEYPRRIFLLPQMNCEWAGLGTIGCGTECIIWINGPYNFYKHIILHEIGHTLGMQHATMKGQEYGDNGNVMGSGEGCFGAPQLWEMNWNTPLLLDLKQNMMTTITIPPLMASNRTIVRTDNYGSFPVLYISYIHSLNILDSVSLNYDKTVMIHQYDGSQQENDNKSNLLAALHENDTFDFPPLNLHFNVTFCNDTFATVQVAKY
jgi:hypothetical protein